MDIYREEILDHFKNPRNFGKVNKMEKKAEERNVSCGDVIKLGVKIKDNKVEEIRFEGAGCAISLAAVSMLTEMIKNKSLRELKSLSEKEILDRLGIRISSARKKCATLGFQAWRRLQKKLI